MRARVHREPKIEEVAGSGVLKFGQRVREGEYLQQDAALLTEAIDEEKPY